MRAELYEEMFQLEATHWWFQARARIVLDVLRRSLDPAAPSPARVADLGCGCGMMLSRLRKLQYDATGMEAFDEAIAFCRQRQVSVVKGFLPGNVPLDAAAFDAVLMLDVLEHLDDDAGSARAAARLLRPGGVMICTVPAYQWLWAKRDEHHQHRRRYGRRQFARLFEIPELRLETLTHYNTALFPIAAAARLATRLRPGCEQATDLRVPVRPVNRLLESIFAAERSLVGRLPLPFGLSLLSVSRRL